MSEDKSKSMREGSMDRRIIEIFYNTYKNSIRTINTLENKLLQESYSYERWYSSLQEKSQTIRELYTENEELYGLAIEQMLRDSEQLTEPVAQTYLTHIDFFMSEGYRDYGAVMPVLNLLIPFYERRNAKEQIFDCYFFKALAIMETRNYPEAAEWFMRALGVYGDLYECTEDYRQFRMMCAYFERLLALCMQEHTDQEQILQAYSSAREVWIERVPEGFLTDKKKSAADSILRTLAGSAVYFAKMRGEEPLPQLLHILSEEYETVGESSYAVSLMMHKIQWMDGQIDQEQYVSCLMSLYQKAQEQFKDGYTYDAEEFNILFDDELADEEFDGAKLFYTNPSFQYVYFVIPELLEHASGQLTTQTLWAEIQRYYTGLPYINGQSVIDYLIERHLKMILPYSADVPYIGAEEPTNFLLGDIFVHRQCCTAIHSLMVSELAETIMEYLVKNHPEEAKQLFENEWEIFGGGEGLIKAAKTAGMCHDTGKIYCTDIINLQARHIQDTEFAMIKEHPRCGASILRESPVLRVYADVAEGHHKTYDGTGGYPVDFDNTASPIRGLIDLITICDSIDAATDGLGRNYTRAKTFHQVLGELKQGAGRRYNDRIVALMAQDEQLIAQIEDEVGARRAQLQYKVYRLFVERGVTFDRKDEKYVRSCMGGDLKHIAAFYEGTREELAYVYHNSRRYRYLLTNGRGRVFGVIFAQPAESGSPESGLDITHVLVDRNYRRQGCGSMLVSHLVDMAYSRGIYRIYMPEVVEGHYDKFGWRNGFEQCDREGYLLRRL